MINFLKDLWAFRKESEIYPYLKASFVLLIIACVTLFTLESFAKEPIRIAVIDTGIVPNLDIPLCKGLSRDFTGYDTLNDNMGHGTIVSSLVHLYAKETNYCQVLLRVFDANDIKFDGNGKPYMEHSFRNVTNAIKYLSTLNVNVVNLSLGGPSGDKEEQLLFKKLLDRGIIIVNAAGNESMNLDVKCNWFPGCYDDRILMVGNLDQNQKPHYTSNYGKRVNVWVVGTNIRIGQQSYTGTSFSAGLLSGALIKILNDKRR